MKTCAASESSANEPEMIPPATSATRIREVKIIARI
jgi:hypothetical protein